MRLVVAGVALGGATAVIGLSDFQQVPTWGSIVLVILGLIAVFAAIGFGVWFAARHKRNRDLLQEARLSPHRDKRKRCEEDARRRAKVAAQNEVLKQIAQPRIAFALAQQGTGQIQVPGAIARNMEFVFEANDGQPLVIEKLKATEGFTTDGVSRVWLEDSRFRSGLLVFFDDESKERLVNDGGSWTVEYDDERPHRHSEGPFEILNSDSGVYIEKEDIDVDDDQIEAHM